MQQAVPMRRRRRRQLRGWLARRITVAVLALLTIPRIGVLSDSIADVLPVFAADLPSLRAPRPPGPTSGESRSLAPAVDGDRPVSASSGGPVSNGVPPEASMGAAADHTDRPIQLPDAEPAISVPAERAWHGTVGRPALVRAAPTRSAPSLGELALGEAVRVERWIAGEAVETENVTWADLGGGRYVYSGLLRSAPEQEPPPPPAGAPSDGRWIDLNLTLQVATAYEGRQAVRSVLVSTGRPGWETPSGTFAIGWRVPKTTMDGTTLVGQGPDGRGATYKVENVRWVQYFAADGSAIHENYWRRPDSFGIPGSHGCIGMLPADARWFWDWARHGTPLVIHE